MMILTGLLCIFAATFAFSSSGEHGHDGAEHAAPKGWVATDTWKAMNFTVLFIVLVILLRKPMSQALNNRIKDIKEQLAALEEQKGEAEKKLEAYNEKIAGLDKEAEKIIGDYIQQGNEAKARILKEAESAAEKLEAQAKRNIEHEIEKAKAALKEEMLEQALVKAEALIKEKIVAEDQDKLVDEYLEKVVA
jgi:F-type H+-transporting ATPase subunit b